MQLLYTKRSPYARKVRILALEKNIPLECIDEDLQNKSQKLLTHNPVGKIPTLILDNGESLCDSPLICEYLDAQYPTPRFIPPDPQKRLKVLNMAAMADGLMDITVGAYLETTRHPKDYNQAWVETQKGNIQRLLRYFNQHSGELSEWHLGSLGVICALGYIQFRLGEVYQPDQYPQLEKWCQGVSRRPSVATTVPKA